MQFFVQCPYTAAPFYASSFPDGLSKTTKTLGKRLRLPSPYCTVPVANVAAGGSSTGFGA